MLANVWIIGNPDSTITGLFGASVVRNLLGANPTAKWYDFDFKANAAIVQAMADEIDVTDLCCRHLTRG
jgi:hypothetical protein